MPGLQAETTIGRQGAWAGHQGLSRTVLQSLAGNCFVVATGDVRRYVPAFIEAASFAMDGFVRPATPEQLLSCLDQLGIRHATTRHAPAFTVEQGNEVWGDIPGLHCKNLFLKDAKAKLWLVVAPAEVRIDLKTLPQKIGSARLSFGSAELLTEVLGIPPGSVTPFALINDPAHRVEVVLDSWMMEQPLLNYHPLTNEATTTVSNDDFRKFLRHCGHDLQIVPVAG